MMSGAQFNQHLNLEKKKIFEADLAERDRDRKKYKGISPHDSAYAFIYRRKQKIVKTLPRLSEIYEFKLQWEKEHG
jgi:hypothetical protein